MGRPTVCKGWKCTYSTCKNGGCWMTRPKDSAGRTLPADSTHSRPYKTTYNGPSLDPYHEVLPAPKTGWGSNPKSSWGANTRADKKPDLNNWLNS